MTVHSSADLCLHVPHPTCRRCRAAGRSAGCPPTSVLESSASTAAKLCSSPQQGVPGDGLCLIRTWSMANVRGLHPHADVDAILIGCVLCSSVVVSRTQKPKQIDLKHLKEQLSEQAKVNVPFHSLHPEEGPPQSLLEKADQNLNGVAPGSTINNSSEWSACMHAE